jgi:hypothetical protein
MDPYVELDCYTTDPASPWWSYQTIVNEGAGTASVWTVDQTIAFPPPSSQENCPEKSTSTLRVRVKDRNSLKKDVLIGKGVLSCGEVTDTQWKEFPLSIKNKKGKTSGNVVLTARLQSPQLSQPTTVWHEGDEASVMPTILLSIQSTVMASRKEQVDALCARYGVKSQQLSDPTSTLLSLTLKESPTRGSDKRGGEAGETEQQKAGLSQLFQCVAELEKLE